VPAGRSPFDERKGIDMRGMKGKLGLALGLTALLTFAVRPFSGSAVTPGADARAVLRNASGQPLGVVAFKQQPGFVVVTAAVRSLSPGFHGFHVHANSDPANGSGCIADPAQPSNTWFVSVDGHYRLGTETHGSHQGDMPLLLLNGTGTGDSTARTRFRTDRFAVADIVGRAIIVHAGADNYANIPLGANTDQYTANSQAAIDKTAATGNAGDRLLCGLVQATGS
jgi:superoxide dismutase, Cu-Zn family